jgi:xylulokinase
MSYLLGIDVGTTGTRSVIIRPDGQVIGTATANHNPMQMPKPGWAEQDPENWWQATIESICGALGEAHLTGDAIAAAGLSGQMHGVVLLDRSNAPLHPALIWCDQRSQRQCDEITSRVGKQKLIEMASNPALTCFSAPKILWIRENKPQVYEKAAHFLLPKDFVRLRLTGEFATDVSDASGTLLFDVTKRRWSSELVSILGIDQALLPRAYEAPEITGRISSETASLTGLKAGTPVVAGGGDQACGAVGTGVVSSGLASATIGSSGVIFAFTDAPKLDPLGRIHTFCHAVPGKWHVMGVTQGAGLSLRWFRDHLCAEETQKARQSKVDVYDLIIKHVEQVPAGSDGLIFLPYLMGERTPHLDPQARGVWFGLTASHTRGHMIRSILEGVAFSLRDSLEIFRELSIPVEQARATGGGSRSSVWRQIQADVYGKELALLQQSEGSAFGAALLAGVGVRTYSSPQEAASVAICISEKIHPDSIRTAQYDRVYRIYRSLYPATRELAHNLAELAT